jgi:spore coat polysaccharide biosynthesis predicted glycosyltransferase SpsG
MINPYAAISSTVKLKVLFLCRGSIRDGLGHVMRSRCVAKLMKEFAVVRFVVIGDESAENLLVNHDLDFTITAMDEYAFHHVEHFAPDIVVFDMMNFGHEAVSRIAARSMIISLSPIFNCQNQMDLVFHRTAICGRDWLSPGGKTVFKCGLDYAIIGDHCQRIPLSVYQQALSHEIMSVAISMGGGDAANKTLALLDRLKHVSDRMIFWVLLGEGYAHSYQDLVQCVRGSKHEIILARTNDAMWRILSTCSLVILASGITTYEAVYAGLPSVNTLESSDQFFLIQELVEKGACTYAGNTFGDSLNSIGGILIRLNRNRDELLRMHHLGQGLIDGQGARRVVSDIVAAYGKRKDLK